MCVCSNVMKIWVRSRNCGCLATWFCYQLIAKPGNKTATVPWPDPYTVMTVNRTRWLAYPPLMPHISKRPYQLSGTNYKVCYINGILLSYRWKEFTVNFKHEYKSYHRQMYMKLLHAISAISSSVCVDVNALNTSSSLKCRSSFREHFFYWLHYCGWIDGGQCVTSQ